MNHPTRPPGPGVTARGIICDDGELLVFKLRANERHYSLPGGHIDFGETIHSALQRELFEETGIDAIVGDLAYVHDLILPDRHKIEFFFWVENGADFREMDLTTASHGYEVTEAIWVPVGTSDVEIRPDWVVEALTAKEKSVKIIESIHTGS